MPQNNYSARSTKKDDAPVRIIDVHSHALPAAYLKGLKQLGVNPLEEDGFPTPTWNPRAALSFVDEQNIDFSILSISTPHINKGDSSIACEIAHNINDELATFCEKHSTRFGFAATLPLPDVRGSIAEAKRAFGLGAQGVKVPSNACGIYLGDSRLHQLYEFLDEQKAVVTIHPSLPPAVPQNVFTAGPAPLFEYLADTTRAVINLVITGTIKNYPDIRWIVPHCGSFIPEVAHRLKGISQVLVPTGLMSEVDALEDLKNLYFDVAGDAEPVMLDALLKITDPSHVLYGSDYPYTPAPLILAKREALLNDKHIEPYIEDIFYNNAAKLYRL